MLWIRNFLSLSRSDFQIIPVFGPTLKLDVKEKWLRAVELQQEFLAKNLKYIAFWTVYIGGKCRIRYQCCGSRMFIPDPNFFFPGSRVKRFPDPKPNQRIKVF
jgi:hypothetical protein